MKEWVGEERGRRRESSCYAGNAALTSISRHILRVVLCTLAVAQPHPCGHSCNSTESNKGLGSFRDHWVARNGAEGVVSFKTRTRRHCVGGSTKGIDLEPKE
jgi:hypothetical protein